MNSDIDRNCLHCANLDDDSDGAEYGAPWFVCSKKPSMSNLKTFPFKNELECFEIDPVFLIDFDAASKIYEDSCMEKVK